MGSSNRPHSCAYISFAVYKWNHDSSYIGDPPPDNGVAHVYLDRFEDLEINMKEIVTQHGRE